MGDLITVLVTGGGAPGIAGSISALRNNPDKRPFRIVTTDINDNVPGKYIADVFHVVPAPESDGYLPTLLDLIEKENISVILPQTTREIAVLSQNIDILEKTGTRVVVSSSEAIETANDKYLLLKKAEECGVPCPEYILTDSRVSLLAAFEALGYPRKKVVVKPRVSNGMRGLRIVTEEPWTVSDFLERKPDGSEIRRDALLDILDNGDWPELIVSEYLPGKEYTIDAFRGAKGMAVIPRVRDQIRSGITFATTVDLRRDLVDYSEKLAESIGLRFCFGFQFKLSKDGVPHLLESNPRVQGTMAASSYAGFNMIYYAVMEALGETVDPDAASLVDGVTFKRYWGGIACNGNDCLGKI